MTQPSLLLSKPHSFPPRGSVTTSCLSAGKGLGHEREQHANEGAEARNALRAERMWHKASYFEERYGVIRRTGDPGTGSLESRLPSRRPPTTTTFALLRSISSNCAVLKSKSRL